MKRSIAALALLLHACVLDPEVIARVGDSPGPGSTQGEDSDDMVTEATSDDPLPIDEGEPPLETEGEQPEPPTCLGDCPCELDVCQQSCLPDPEQPCELDCPPGAMCLQTCDLGFCTSTCFHSTFCQIDCLAMGCHSTCWGSEECSLGCVGGSCSMACEQSQSCHMHCPQGGCQLQCSGGSTCVIEGCPFGCTMFCADGSDCSLDCGDPASCMILPL